MTSQFLDPGAGWPECPGIKEVRNRSHRHARAESTATAPGAVEPLNAGVFTWSSDFAATSACMSTFIHCLVTDGAFNTVDGPGPQTAREGAAMFSDCCRLVARGRRRHVPGELRVRRNRYLPRHPRRPLHRSIEPQPASRCKLFCGVWQNVEECGALALRESSPRDMALRAGSQRSTSQPQEMTAADRSGFELADDQRRRADVFRRPPARDNGHFGPRRTDM